MPPEEVHNSDVSFVTPDVHCMLSHIHLKKLLADVFVAIHVGSYLHSKYAAGFPALPAPSSRRCPIKSALQEEEDSVKTLSLLHVER